MTGMERNSDLIIMSCYAPLFVNVSSDSVTGKKAWQWDSDLVGYDALSSYGSPSYYVQKLFSHYLGNKIVPVAAANIPIQARPLTKKDSTDGIKFKTVPALFYSATMNDTTGTIYLKIVNITAKKETVKINLVGVGKVLPEATWVVIKGNKPNDTNTITAPENIIPVTSKTQGLTKAFSRTLDPYSVSIILIKTSK
jgi:alpha-N-arabinofuranosidase